MLQGYKCSWQNTEKQILTINNIHVVAVMVILLSQLYKNSLRSH